jgi:glyoxylase-like metal-dependent hydrolase (beta-lactamase superfamily II)
MSVNTKRLVVGAMQSNCYLVWDSQKNAIIIDPGDDADYIMQNIRDLEIVPKALVATHGHFDHLMATLELKLAYNIPFYIHKKDDFLLERMDKTAMHFLNFDPGPPPEVDVYLKNNSILKFPAYANRNNGETSPPLSLKIIHTPGHTPGSVCIHINSHSHPRDVKGSHLGSKGLVFCGDLIFVDGVGRTDFSYSNKKGLLKSIKKIMKLPKDTIIYPGHGEELSLHKKSSLLEKLQLD